MRHFTLYFFFLSSLPPPAERERDNEQLSWCSRKEVSRDGGGDEEKRERKRERDTTEGRARARARGIKTLLTSVSHTIIQVCYLYITMSLPFSSNVNQQQHSPPALLHLRSTCFLLAVGCWLACNLQAATATLLFGWMSPSTLTTSGSFSPACLREDRPLFFFHLPRYAAAASGSPRGARQRHNSSAPFLPFPSLPFPSSPSAYRSPPYGPSSPSSPPPPPPPNLPFSFIVPAHCAHERHKRTPQKRRGDAQQL